MPSDLGETRTCFACKAVLPVAAFTKVHEGRYYSYCKPCRNLKAVEYNARRKAKVFTHYGNACVCCGETEPVFLTLDHVNGGGTKERKTKRTAFTWEVALREGMPDRFRILCWNCNWAVHHLGGQCPHQGEG